MAIKPAVPLSQSFLRLAVNFLDACDSPLSGAARRRDWMALVSQPMPSVDQDVHDFRLQYFAAESFSKFPFTIPSVDREAEALRRFWRAEECCADANERLVDPWSRMSLPSDILRRARSAVASILGESFSWDEAASNMSFGPGSSTSVPRRLACDANKWAFSSQVTQRCLPVALALQKFWGLPSHYFLPLEVVQGNRITTVPKNAKTDRVIAIEPDWNMFIQRGIGTMIRSRLQRRLGLLTQAAQFNNRNLAAEGSRSGRFATIDLSAASDSVSLALCELLLPPEWFSAILTARSSHGFIDGAWHEYAKVSSMGNGFTFELETLFFWGLAKAVCGRSEILVYGDDIIVETSYAQQVIDLLRVVGFEVNSKKTFLSGPFRESCGGHYFQGFDVTPPYFKENLVDTPESIRAANKVSRAASRRYAHVRDARFFRAFSVVAGTIPQCHIGPESLGDQVLWGPFEDAAPKRARRRVEVSRWDGSRHAGPDPIGRYQVNAFVKKAVTHPIARGPWAMLASLWGPRVTEERHQTGGVYRRKWITVDKWEAPGPWLAFD